jgi:hypothetical protein
MTDRELLEAAAKAAGYAVRWVEAVTSMNYQGFKMKAGKMHAGGFPLERAWNPLTDDGDALRLAVALELNVFHAAGKAYACDSEAETEHFVSHEKDAAAATRRAIVRAAAALWAACGS